MIILACEKSETPPPEEDDEDQQEQIISYLSRYITSRNDSIVIDYNSDKTVSRHANVARSLNPNSSFVYYPKYEGGKLKTFYFTNDVMDQTGRLIYEIEYTGDHITKVKNLSGTGIPYFNTIYNDKGQMIERHYFMDQVSSVYIVAKYTWENNNIVSLEEVVVPDKDTAREVYKYDNKPNAFKSIGIMMLYTFYYDIYLSANNVIEKVQTASYGNTVTTYEYTYSDNNYPLSRAVIERNTDNNNIIHSGTERFEYLQE